MYIEQRRRRWYAVLDIPTSVRPVFGKKRMVQSLETEDKSEAERLALPLIANWKSMFSEAKTNGSLDKDIQFWRNAIKDTPDNAAELTEEYGDPTQSDRDVLLDHLQQLSSKMNKKQQGSGKEFYDRVTGKKTGTKDYIDQWYASLTNELKTKHMKKAAVEKLAKTFPTLEGISRKQIQIWAQKQVTDNGLTANTVLRDVSFLRNYWEYLQSMEAVSEDLFPFEKIKLTENKKEALRKRRRAFKPEEVVGLLNAANEKKDQQLADLITLGMWTGARIEELCALKVANVTDRSFKIEDAKTESGWREVPIHSNLKPVMDRLIKDDKDGYVLSGLSSDNMYSNRSGAIGKRFGRLKTELGYRPKVEVFHSIRKTVTTLLKNAGVPEVIAADIVGHDVPTLTYGLYASEADFEVVSDAIERLDYMNFTEYPPLKSENT